ncbi:MAG: M23 family metallopeptidase [Rhizomicrobium sp.]
MKSVLQTLVLGCLACLAPAAEAVDAAKPGIGPRVPLIEHTAYGDSLNFDIIADNPASEALEITQLEVEYLDGAGATLLARRLDINSGAIRTIAERRIEPRQVRMIFNPFPVLPRGLHPAAVRATVWLSKPDAKYLPVGHLEFAAKRTFTASVAERRTAHLLLPLQGRVWVWDGHDLYSHHRRWNYAHPAARALGYISNMDRYAYDFVLVDSRNRMAAHEDDERNEDYVGYKAPVRAVADGTVLQMRSSEPDNRTFDEKSSTINPLYSFGNYILLDHGGGVYSVFGHLHQGSVRVKVGDRVRRGEKIGEVGSSGSSLFPHLHYEMIDGYRPGGEGLPSYFDRLVRVRGAARETVSGSIDSGDIVEAR